MTLLGIDASSENLSLCLQQKDELIFDINQRMSFGASFLIEYIQKGLKKNSLDLKDIDAFVIGSGPGSFTGLRISFSIIKAFIMAIGRPAIAIGSFFSCAYPLGNKSESIAVISDARRNLIYAACFQAKKDVVRREAKEGLFELNKFIKDKKNYLFVTYDAQLRKRILNLDSQINFYPKNVYPQARYLLPFAQKYYNEAKFTPLEKLKPLYLHPKTCQIQRV